MHPISARRLVAVPLLVLGLAVTGCSGDDSSASEPSSESAGSATSSPAGQPEADDADEVGAEVKGLGPLLSTLRREHSATIGLLSEAVQEPGDLGVANEAQAQSERWEEARVALDGALGPAAIVVSTADEPVVEAFDAYRSQAQALMDAEGDIQTFYASYVVCNRTLQLGILQRADHATSAAGCIEAAGLATATGDRELVAYGEAMTRLMERRVAAYESFDRTARSIGVPDPDALTSEDLNAAGDGFVRLGEEADRVGDELVEAYEEFLPTLEALTAGGGLDRMLEAASPDAAYDDLVAAVRAFARQ